MPASTWNLPWLNHNAQRSYPVSNDATKRDLSGDFELPDDFIVGIDLPISAGVSIIPSKFFVRSIGSFATGFAITVGYAADTGDINVATALISRAAHTPDTVYSLGGIGDFTDTFGTIVIGKLASIDLQPAGTFTFDLAGSRLEADAVRPDIRHVSAIVVVNGENRSQRIVGDVVFTAGTNMQLIPISVSGQDPEIQFNAIEGEGLTEECVCEGEIVTKCISTINGIAPTAAGNFTLLSNDAVELLPLTNGIQINDIVSSPCCGCEELEVITTDLGNFGSNAITLENFMVRLETTVNTMSQTVLGTRLNDQGGCPECP